MNRKLCVLIYSQYSPASQALVEYIQQMPYDFAKITGLTFLPADSEIIREKLIEKNITVVPSLFVQYFDGQTLLLENETIYKFIASVNKTITQTSEPISEKQDASKPVEIGTEKVVQIGERKNVMSMAMSMQKERDENEPEPPIGAPPRNRTALGIANQQ
jgi:hypothetical protein